MLIIKRFKYLPYVLIGILGISIAGVSFYFLTNRYTEPIEMKDIVVTARDIPMYEIIRRQDLKTIQVPADTKTDNYFVEMEDILGKVSKIPLASDDLILEDYLLNKEDLENIEFITINTSYAKTGGAKPGDSVDVYKIMVEKGDWVEGNQASLIAQDVVVVSLTTSTGKSIEGIRMPLGGSEKVEVVKLAVKPQYVKYLVPAAVSADNGYVLVVKNAYTYSKQDVERDPDIESILNQNKEAQEGGVSESDEDISEEQEGDNSSTEGSGQNN